MRRWIRWLPGIETLRRYEAAWLPHDIFAGLVLATMLVPVGIAYAVASGLPGIYGLYATIIPLLVYALFGPSRILVLGPDSALAAVILGVVVPLSGGDPLRAVTLAGMMAIVSGTVCILAGIARLGFVTELLSKPIRYGYMNGIALTVLISQLPKLFGFSIESDGPLRSLWAIADAILEGKTNWVAFGIGLGTLMVILLLQGNKRLPGILIAVVAATAVVGVLDLADPLRRGGSWSSSAGPTGFRDPLDHLRRYRPGTDGRLRRCPGFVCGHQRAFARLCRTIGRSRRSQPGNGGAWRRQSGSRLFSRLPDQQQLFAYSRCRSRRRPYPANQRRRRACHRHPSAWWHQTCFSICPPLHWRPSSSPLRSACLRSPTSSGSIGSSSGSSGYRWSASSAWRCSE